MIFVFYPLIKKRVTFKIPRYRIIKAGSQIDESQANRRDNKDVNVIAMPERQFVINVIMDEEEVDTSKFGDIIINSSQYIRQTKDGTLSVKYYKHKVDFSKYYIPKFKLEDKSITVPSSIG